MDRSKTFWGAVALAALAVGCSESGGRVTAPVGHTQEPVSAAPAPAPTEAARAEAREIFGSRCMPCHGPTGGGDGPASAGLTPRPRNFHDAAWQAKVTDEHIEKIIQYGGSAVGLAPMMPANPDLSEKPATIAALREHVRSLKQ